MKPVLLLAFHNRIDDALAHLEILKYYREPLPVITITTHPEPHTLPQVLRNNLATTPSLGHWCGASVSLIAGMRRAFALGYDAICYRNADDWMFDPDFTADKFALLNDYWAVGYNYISHNSLQDVALHELYLRLLPFVPSLDVAHKYFTELRAGGGSLAVEIRVMRWLKRVLPDMDKFYRHPDREVQPSINLSTEEDNNRWFCRNWKFVGFHDNIERKKHYNLIRDQIPYAADLEKEEHFSRWLNGTKWNDYEVSSSTPNHLRPQPRVALRPRPRKTK